MSRYLYAVIYDNWDIPGDVYPDNTPTQTYSVILDATQDDVLLDVTVTIDTLKILGWGTLNVTQSGAGNLAVVDEGVNLTEGTIYVDHDRSISVPNGPVTIGEYGQYLAASLNTSAGLTAATVRLRPTYTDEQVLLTGSMSLTTMGDLVLDGMTTAELPCVPATGVTPSSRGGGGRRRL